MAKGKKPRGRPKIRPSVYDAGMTEAICEGLISGLELSAVCKPETMPSETEVYRTMAKDTEFASAIARARSLQQEAIADECVKLADSATSETKDVVKLRIWARQWRAGKLNPKKYGDKTTLAGDPENPVLVQTIRREIVRTGNPDR